LRVFCPLPIPTMKAQKRIASVIMILKAQSIQCDLWIYFSSARYNAAVKSLAAKEMESIFVRIGEDALLLHVEIVPPSCVVSNT